MNYKILKELYKIGFFDKVISVLNNIGQIKVSDIFHFYLAKINPNSRLKFLEDRFDGAEEDRGEIPEQLDGADENIKSIYREELNLFDQSIEWRTHNACVPTNLYVGLCHNIGVIPEYKFWKNLLTLLEKEGLWKENYGASIPRVANRILEIWNKTNPNNKVKLLKKYHDFSLIEKGYLMTGGRNTFPQYSKDVADNNNIDSKNYKWSRKGGHCLNIGSGKIIKNLKKYYITKGEKRTLTNIKVEKDYTIAVNSYPKRNGKYNYYGHNLLKEHIDNNIWYDYFYCFVSDNEKPKEEYKYFLEDYKHLEDQENKDLFKVMQKALKETGYKPKNRTILGSNADRTNARIYVTIMLARNYGENVAKIKRRK